MKLHLLLATESKYFYYLLKYYICCVFVYCVFVAFQNCPGLEQYVIKKYAESLESLPRALAENAGVKVSTVLQCVYSELCVYMYRCVCVCPPF